MMMLCLCELTDTSGDHQGWTVHLRGAKEIVRLQRQQLQYQNAIRSTTSASSNNSSQLPPATLSCSATTFGPPNPPCSRRHRCVPTTPTKSTSGWAAARELVSILCSITELNRIPPHHLLLPTVAAARPGRRQFLLARRLPPPVPDASRAAPCPATAAGTYEYLPHLTCGGAMTGNSMWPRLARA
ncbi:hypothetical protein VTO42DRAFT_7060 [Malbranchea cinnamomea]